MRATRPQRLKGPAVGTSHGSVRAIACIGAPMETLPTISKPLTLASFSRVGSIVRHLVAILIAAVSVLTVGARPSSAAVLAGWDVSTQQATNFGPSPYAVTTSDPNLTVGGLTRGTGVGTSGTGAKSAWGGNTWTSSTESAAVTANQFVTFAVTAKAGYQVSFTNISRFDYRRSATGAASGVLQYQIGTGQFTDGPSVSYTSTSSTGASLSVPIDLSGITALQNVPPGTTVTFRIVNWGGTSASGTWYIYNVNTANPTANDFEIGHR